jgi:hypothetical protein
VLLECVCYNDNRKPIVVLCGVKREAYRLTSHDHHLFTFPSLQVQTLPKKKKNIPTPSQCSVTDSTVGDEITQFPDEGESVPRDLCVPVTTHRTRPGIRRELEYRRRPTV